MGLFTSIALGALALGGTAAAITSAQRTKMPEIPNIEAPKVEDAAAKAAAIAKQKKQAMARSQTVYTSPLGVQQEATTAKKYLLGQ